MQIALVQRFAHLKRKALDAGDLRQGLIEAGDIFGSDFCEPLVVEEINEETSDRAYEGFRLGRSPSLFLELQI